MHLVHDGSVAGAAATPHKHQVPMLRLLLQQAQNMGITTSSSADASMDIQLAPPAAANTSCLCTRRTCACSHSEADTTRI